MNFFIDLKIETKVLRYETLLSLNRKSDIKIKLFRL